MLATPENWVIHRLDATLYWVPELTSPPSGPAGPASRDLDAAARRLAGAAPVGLLLRDQDRRATYANGAWLAIAGIALDAALGDGWQRALDPPDRERVLAAFAESDRNLRPVACDAGFRRPDGALRRVRLRSAPLCDDGGAVIGAVATAEDITDAAVADARLAVGEHQYRLMFTHMQNGFALHRVILDADGKPVDYEFLALNPAYTEMTGLRPEATIGRRVTEVLPGTERDPANWIQVFGEVALTGRTIRIEALSEAIGKWFEVVAYRPEPMQFAVLIHEITGRKELEWALLEASAREQQQLGRELHDGLGQEITGIALLAEGIARAAARAHSPNATELKRLAEIASHAIGTCRGLAHGLSPLDETDGDLRAALHGLAKRQTDLGGPVVHFENAGRAPLQLAKSSADHLYRIAQEAVSNALRYADARHVVIRLTVRPARIRLEIEDDGKGCGASPRSAAGIGMKTMDYRARVLGGELVVGERAAGGTRVACNCPQPEAPGRAAGRTAPAR